MLHFDPFDTDLDRFETYEAERERGAEDLQRDLDETVRDNMEDVEFVENLLVMQSDRLAPVFMKLFNANELPGDLRNELTACAEELCGPKKQLFL